MTLRAVSAVLGSGCGSLGAFGQHPPDVFIRRVEEPVKGSVLRRVELPQIKVPLLTREDPTDEHYLDYINKPDWFVTRDWMHVCNPVTSFSSPHDRPVSFQDISRMGGPDRNSGAAAHSGWRGSVM